MSMESGEDDGERSGRRKRSFDQGESGGGSQDLVAR